jgi:hypothetical protein
MTTTYSPFFSTTVNRVVIQRFAKKLEEAALIEAPLPDVVTQLKTFFKAFANRPEVFDQRCEFNTELIGQTFIQMLQDFLDTNSETSAEDQLINIFSTAYRLLCELEYSMPNGLFSMTNDLFMQLVGIKNFVDRELEKFNGRAREELVWASYLMPAAIVKRMLTNPSLAHFRSFDETAKKAEQLKTTWDAELADKDKQIEALRGGLNNITTDYNFVGLMKGFEALALTKKSEHAWSRRTLYGLGLMMLIPVGIHLWFTLTHINTIEDHKSTLMYSLPPLIALEVILLYFFRVVLANFRSISAQLLQINLRRTLCQFIQNYSEYSTKIKKDDPSALAKFENLIFSGIVADSDSMPSTFDGMDQIAKFVNSLRGKSA